MRKTTLTLQPKGLILTRRPGEAIMIGDTITVLISSINGNQARVMVDAPKDVPVHRLEIYRRIQIERETGRAVHACAEPWFQIGKHSCRACIVELPQAIDPIKY